MNALYEKAVKNKQVRVQVTGSRFWVKKNAWQTKSWNKISKKKKKTSIFSWEKNNILVFLQKKKEKNEWPQK